jgi:hypothetical protein
MALSAYRTNGFAFPLRALAEAEAVELCGRHLHSIASTMHQPERVNPHLLWPWVDRICRSAPLLDAVARVLESDQILLWESAWFLKHPGSSEFVSYHQDSTYLGLERGDQLTTAWIALSESGAASGALSVLAGSHLRGQLRHTETVDELNQLSKGQQVRVSAEQERAAVTLLLRPGEFSLHHEKIVHASGLNRSAAPRLGLAVRYIASSEAPASPPDWAMPVLGDCRGGDWLLSRSPLAEAGKEERAHHSAVLARREVIEGGPLASRL